ncbi:NitT/TauT family transport system ATP-binding protein [Methylobacter tundripaludum]|uniref:NitT/TauT family transport system ATP-binding protein n=1 Tax=Methylobacter tundripaludum TaxID=173365 RepID=A0A2S6HI86_9GAMM|nr:ABC transporter ATP-binding protein [Methylobacter tundripaludum]PPK77103.1 NitT/TauT family transport system ATP-binding protein [Methylobacter tundripaludum]
MTDIQININNKTYPTATQPSIANLQLSLNSNEFICLVGPSGCGKTTLLNIIAGLDNDYDGEILVGQQHTPPKIGYIFQNPRLLPWRTVRENIELVLSEHQSPDVIDALLEVMQLTQAQHVYPERLSLGMSRRVSIIRAFAIDPEVLLMDEPFVSLDAPTARQVRELLVKLWQQRPHTVLFVTHDLREAIALADRLIFLSAPPMQVVSEIIVPIARSERGNELAIESFRQQLLQNHPEIKQLL